MLAKNIVVGKFYRALVSGKLTTVEVLEQLPRGGYTVVNTKTGRKLRFKTAAKFRDPSSDPTKQGRILPKEEVVAQDTPFKGKLSERLGSRLNGVTKTLPHVVVIALAGSGKTFTLIIGVAFTFLMKAGKWSNFLVAFANEINRQAGEQKVDPKTFKITPSEEQKDVWEELMKSEDAKTVAYAAFNKSIVTEFGEKYGWLKDMLLQFCGVTLTFSTINALGYRSVCDAFGRFGYNAVTDWHSRNLLSKITGRDLRELEKDDMVLVKAVHELVGLVKLTLTGWTEEDGFKPEYVTDDALDELCHHFDIELSNRDQAYDLTRQVLEESLKVAEHREIDFNDQNWLPIVLNLPVQQFDLLLVDEAQDLPQSKQQYAIRAGRRIIIVGDINQAIYGFAGADVDSIPRMQKLLGVDGVPVQPVHLTQTRRCGKAIVERANATLQRCYQHRGDNNPLQFVAHESNPEGEVRETTLEKYIDEVTDGDMCLCRVNAPLVSQALKLIKMGRKAIIRGRDFGEQLINFVKKMKASDVGELMEKVEDWYETEAQKESRKKNPSEAKLIMLEDKRSCIEAFCENAKTVDDVIALLNRVFAGKVCPKCNKGFDEDKLDRCPNKPCKTERDPVTGYECGPKLVTPKGVLFSSIHRAKGLEADRVFHLMRDAPIPHPMAKSAWQFGQELHCLYICQSRPINVFVEVK